MTCRGIRGATTVKDNTESSIIAGSTELLKNIISKNQIEESDIVSILFSITEDLNATFPAKAAREMGLIYTPLLCFHEVSVPHGLEKCIRILMHINSEKSIKDIKHIYLEGAIKLRPELTQ